MLISDDIIQLGLIQFFLIQEGGGYKVQHVGVYKVQQVRVYKVSLFWVICSNGNFADSRSYKVSQIFLVREMSRYKVQQFRNFPESGWL